jgi:tetratricopeptide (TPR) repeat protein
MKSVILLTFIGISLFNSDCNAQFVSYSTPGPFSLTLTASRSGISVDGQISLVTPVGTFSIGTSYPDIRNHTLVILRDRNTDTERVYRIETGKGELQVDVNGRGRISVKDREVIIDMTDGDITRIRLKNWERGQRTRLVESLMAEGTKHLKSQSYSPKKAVEKFTEVIQYDETNVDAYVFRSYAYVQQVGPTSPGPAITRIYLPLLEAALSDAKKAVGLAPENADAAHHLRIALVRLGKLTSNDELVRQAEEARLRAAKLGYYDVFYKSIFDRYDIKH